MESIDNLIFSLYQAAAEDDWRSFRQRGLAQVSEGLGASAAAWWTHGSATGLDRGDLTQFPHAHVTAEAMAALPFPASPDAMIERPSGSGRSVAIRYAHRDGALSSTLLLSFAAGKKLPTMESIKRLAGHLADAGALCLRQFIRRDDWLHSMGRTSRGAAALVDADGAVHAASDRFVKLIGGEAAASVNQLPFELPEDVQGYEGGEFINGSLHVRVSREAPLYLIYARQPLPLDALSPREQEIARAIGDGKTLKSIARQYGIAVSTVANHTTRIYRKLAIYRREDLIELVRMRPESARKNG
jgi:DNA-binding CsgD family transcriptional regulator